MDTLHALVKPKLLFPIKRDDSPPNGNWPLIKKFNCLRPLSHRETNILKRLHEQEIMIGARQEILNHGNLSQKSFIVNQGWAYRYYDLSNGKRQIINYYLPGDIINPFSLVRPKATYSIASISSLYVSVFKPSYLISLFITQPKLGLLYMKILCEEDNLSMGQIVRLGSQTAYQRAAHLFLEFYYRLKIVGQTENSSFLMPLTQQLLAETLGLSQVHMNRTIHKLQLHKLIRINSKKISLLNIERLKQIAEYQALEEQPTKPSLAATRHKWSTLTNNTRH
jgi:CRP-like cAMP-binding protein